MPKPAQALRGTTDGATVGAVAKISISIDDDLYRRVREAAGKEGVSAWLSAAADTRLRNDVLREVTEEIALETGGPFTEKELAEADKWLHWYSTPER